MPGPCEVTAFVKSFSTHTASLRAEAFTTSAHSNTTQLDRAPPDASSPIANEVLQCIASLYAIGKDFCRSSPENVTLLDGNGPIPSNRVITVPRLGRSAPAPRVKE